MSEVICPHCKNPIYDEDALSCHFCGNSLGPARTSGGLIGRMRGAGMQWVWVTLVLIVLAALVLSM